MRPVKAGRGPTAIKLKAKRPGRREHAEGYTACSLAVALGVDSHWVLARIPSGKLRASRRIVLAKAPKTHEAVPDEGARYRCRTDAPTHRPVSDDLACRAGCACYQLRADRPASGYGPAAVYRHFSTLADPLPACARSTHVLQPVTPALVADIFRGLDRPSSRMEVLVRGTCECYERDGAWLRAARYEEHLVEPLEELARVQRANLALLVRAALTGTKASERATRVMAALSDFPVWEKLRVAGLNAAEATEQVLELVRDQLGKENTP